MQVEDIVGLEVGVVEPCLIFLLLLLLCSDDFRCANKVLTT